jgi:hypothetical protein
VPPLPLPLLLPPLLPLLLLLRSLLLRRCCFTHAAREGRVSARAAAGTQRSSVTLAHA